MSEMMVTVYEDRWVDLRRRLIKMRAEGWTVKRVYTEEMHYPGMGVLRFRCADLTRK